MLLGGMLARGRKRFTSAYNVSVYDLAFIHCFLFYVFCLTWFFTVVSFLWQAAYDRVRKAKQQAAERTRKLDEKRKKVKLGNKIKASFSLGLKSSLAGCFQFFSWNAPLTNLPSIGEGCGAGGCGGCWGC